MKTMWMVRAGQKARFLDEFRDKSSVAIGWRLLKDLSGLKSQGDVAKAVRLAWPEWTPAKVRMSASQVYRFAHEIQIGDRVISYDPQSRAYLLGDFVSDYLFQPNSVAGWGHIRTVDWEEMQELVAGILRAMGYKTEVSPVGPDRGKDIIASPDGFGFESLRIVVEVKHRKGQMGAQAIRSFLGGRHKDEKGLYVSTGGFSKDAHYEAERANIPITVLTLDGLVEKSNKSGHPQGLTRITHKYYS